jgi:hypothetical protein
MLDINNLDIRCKKIFSNICVKNPSILSVDGDLGGQITIMVPMALYGRVHLDANRVIPKILFFSR